MNYGFPPGVIARLFKGMTIRVQGSDYLLGRAISEGYDQDLAQLVAVFESTRLTDHETVVLKLRIQLDPESIPERDRAGRLWMATNWFREEARLLRECQSTEHRTPHFYGHEELVQGASGFFPGGYLHVIAMSKVPGKAVTSYKKFTESEIIAMQHQLTATLEHMRVRGWRYSSPNQDDLFFDRSTMHLSLVGLSGIGPTQPRPNMTITPTSFDVTSFGLNALPHTKGDYQI
ncbi:hypothetical protein DTO271D3_5603 [Paecilomyces variotii]|nr:hypothetical protein DTO271D3_5603 [Paecilomyces variotii]KAJ9362139.1 hypothetical protein DTO027B9_570 [Paecilomyces variotii]